MISIITITFNNFAELKATLESFKGLPSDFEILVINGGNCEVTKQYLEVQKIRNITEKDEGISDAMNKGIHYANQPFVTHIHSGDLLINQEYFLKAAEKFKSDSGIDYIYGNIIFNHERYGKILCKPSLQIGDMPFSHPGLILRKSIFEKIGYFDKNLKIAMDYGIVMKLLKFGFRGFYLDTAPVIAMDGKGASSRDGMPGINERIQVLKSLDLFSVEAKRYLYALKLKTYARKLLQQLKIDNAYDRIRGRI